MTIYAQVTIAGTQQIFFCRAGNATVNFMVTGKRPAGWFFMPDSSSAVVVRDKKISNDIMTARNFAA